MAIPVNNKALRNELDRLKSEVYMRDSEGNEITRAMVLAKLIWDAALGYVSEHRDELGKLVKKVVPPQPWAQQYLFERLEGKATPQAVEVDTAVKASDRVRDLAKDRLNKIAMAAAGPPKLKK